MQENASPSNNIVIRDLGGPTTINRQVQVSNGESKGTVEHRIQRGDSCTRSDSATAEGRGRDGERGREKEWKKNSRGGGKKLGMDGGRQERREETVQRNSKAVGRRNESERQRNVEGRSGERRNGERRTRSREQTSPRERRNERGSMEARGRNKQRDRLNERRGGTISGVERNGMESDGGEAEEEQQEDKGRERRGGGEEERCATRKALKEESRSCIQTRKV